ncbi:hypothetical protein [Paraburkholderia franconis]|uniref:hypothetical protein n=1 Tax=Paraburkholderia franconis TaxID=2654983 RepID=UPI00187B20EB|nr:hypothetical protein [Paraburkholderia franconis]
MPCGVARLDLARVEDFAHARRRRRRLVLVRIVLIWLITLPVTMVGAGVIFYLLANPKL